MKTHIDIGKVYQENKPILLGVCTSTNRAAYDCSLWIDLLAEKKGLLSKGQFLFLLRFLSIIDLSP